MVSNVMQYCSAKELIFFVNRLLEDKNKTFERYCKEIDEINDSFLSLYLQTGIARKMRVNKIPLVRP